MEDNEACVKGTWLDSAGEAHTFFGCDTVVVSVEGSATEIDAVSAAGDRIPDIFLPFVQK